MDLDLKNSETSKHLIASYIGLLTLFIILWVVDSHNIDRQQRLISSQENSVQKMRLIADMLEIVRT